MNIDCFFDKLFPEGINKKDHYRKVDKLIDLVLEAADMMAESVNNSGPKEQIKFL